MAGPADFNDKTLLPDGDGPTGLEGQLVAGRFQVEKLLGSGGMGAVYRAQHVHMRKRVALKVLHREMTHQAEVVARFEREAVAAARIEHPHVAAALDFGRLEDDSFYLVLEFVEGQSLRAEIDRDRVFPASRALHIARQIASALAAAHGLGVVHRDLKPDNVMLVSRGADTDFVKVLDFGIAKLTSPESSAQPALTQFGSIFGTPEYMSPEQAMGQPVDHRSDLYSLGILVYEMLSGIQPFTSDNTVAILAQQMTCEPPPLPAHVDAELAALVMRLLSKRPDDRPRTSGELVAGLEAISLRLGGGVPGAPSTALAPRATGSSPLLERATRAWAALLGAARPAVTACVRRATSALTQLVRSAASRIEASPVAGRALARLPPTLRREIALGQTRLPAWSLLAAGACSLLGVGLTLGAVRAVRSEPAEPGVAPSVSAGPMPLARPAPPPSNPAPTGPGLDALRADIARVEAVVVYKRTPEDWLTLARGYAALGRRRESILAYRAVLSRNRSMRNDSQLLADFRAAARDPDAFPLVVNLSEGRAGLGDAGLDLLWDLWVELRNERDRASETEQIMKKLWILSRRASPALRAAIELEITTECDKIAALLSRAARHADQRAAPRLLELTNGKGCGSSKDEKCVCLQGSSELALALASAQRRPAPKLENGYR